MAASTQASSLKPSDRPFSQENMIELARRDFFVFIQVMFQVLHPGMPLIYAPYIELIAEYLGEVDDGEIRRITFNLPPGFMKSTIISILYTAWRLGVDPSQRFICISYGDDLAHELSERTRKVMTSSLYKKIFPGTVLEKKAQDHLKTTKGGARYSTSVGSDITGFRADVIIMDDPLQTKDAASQREKSFLQKWFFESVMTRFADASKGVAILVMHRLAPDDLSGVLEQTGWETVKLSAVAEEDETYESGEEIIFQRKVGELLNPAFMTQRDLTKLRKELPPHVFEAQYQQRPSSSGSGLFDISRASRYDRPPKCEFTIHSWDIGGTLKGNYSVCTKFGFFENSQGAPFLVVLDVVRIKQLLPDVEAMIETLMRHDKPALVVLDGNGIGLGPAQSLQRKHGVIRIKTAMGDTQTTKIERFGQAMSLLYGGRILLPRKAPWLEAWLYEMVGFPDGEYDDQVDSFTQVAAFARGAITYARISRDRM